MNLRGTEYFKELSQQPYYSAKMVFNAYGAILFPAKAEHRDQKAAGISYEDDYKGNALAAVLSPGKIEVRFHKRYPDDRVAAILRDLSSQPELVWIRSCAIRYQGRTLTL